jgi:hypothetical protein
MANWRIKEVTYYPGTKDEKKKYFIEKRFLGFLWWYDPYEDGLYSDGEHNTYEEALKIVTKELTYKKGKETKIVWTNET